MDSFTAPYIVDFCSSSSARRCHSFPPPLSFCVTLSIKEGGRFVLKEVHAKSSPQSCFRAERENGRLRLCLVGSEDLDECKEVCDSNKLASQLLDMEVQDASEHLLCDCSDELSENMKTTGDVTFSSVALKSRHGDANAVDISEIYDENLNIGQGDANADDVPEICDGILDVRHGDTNADDVPDICDTAIGARHDYPNADDVHETSEDVCRIYAASFSDVNRHCAGIGGPGLSNFENMHSLNSRVGIATDVCIDSLPDIPYVCMDSVAEIPSSEMAPQILEASTPTWTTSDTTLLIGSCHGSFAKLSPTVDLTVS